MMRRTSEHSYSIGIEGGHLHEHTGKHTLVCLRRTFERDGMGIVRLSVVHHDHRDTDWPAVFQIRQSGILSVWKGSCVRRRCGQPACQHRLVDCVGNPDGSRQCRNRRCLLHYNHRNSLWQAVLQDRQTGAFAVRGNGEVDSDIGEADTCESGRNKPGCC